jgi:S-adenosylmethionine hydrolase
MGEIENQQNTIVTLTTDFGRQDYYLALLKGVMLCENPQLNIVDITHEIKNYDIIRAAFIFKNAWKYFPKETIHVLSVNDYSSGLPSFIAIKHEGHYFLGPDNGIFSLVFDVVPEEIYKLPAQKDSNFELKDIFSLAIGHISAGHGLYNIGEQQESMLTRINFQPVTGPDHIRGAVIHIDNYDNVITNIGKALFEKVGLNRPFSLTFKGHSPISKMSSHYHDVPIGEELCMFNSADHLEVAINMGNAAGLLGFDLEDTVQIDFFNLEHED